MLLSSLFRLSCARRNRFSSEMFVLGRFFGVACSLAVLPFTKLQIAFQATVLPDEFFANSTNFIHIEVGHD